MSKLTIALVVAVVAALAPGAHHAQANPKSTPSTVALAPLSTLGSQKARALRRLEGVVEKALATVEGTRLIAAKDVVARVRKSGSSRLRACDGDVACLADLGQLVSADQIVYGEVGGLGKAQVIYLKVVDVKTRRELRSTTLEVGQDSSSANTGGESATRLLAPERYMGQLVTEVDTAGAKIFIDGELVGQSPAKPIGLPVGSHALRVTHPEYRDYVRFVDIRFAEPTKIVAHLRQYPVVARSMRQDGNAAAPLTSDPSEGDRQTRPWYRRWYTIAGGGALLLVTSAVISGALASGIDADREKSVR